MTKNDLKPCPWCLSRPGLHKQRGRFGWQVLCVCGARLGSFRGSEEAVKQWNSRPDSETWEKMFAEFRQSMEDGHPNPEGATEAWLEQNPTPKETPRQNFFRAVSRELDGAYKKHGDRVWTRHEFYAILKEEVDELWDAIKKDAPIEEIEKEMIQVSAMPLRFYETSLNK